MKKSELPEYTYVNNPKTLTEVMFDFVRGILQIVFPFLRLKPFAKLVDKVFASQFARSFLGSYAMVLMM